MRGLSLIHISRIIQQRTLLLLALLGIGTFLLLFAQLYKLQIKQHDELKTLAVRQQTLRTTVEASRGTIYDKNGDILALSSTCLLYTSSADRSVKPVKNGTSAKMSSPRLR